MENKDIKLINEKELAKCDNNLLNANQLNYLLKKTPESHKYKRPAKGGGEWDYVTGVYVKKVLNLMFGWNWDFEVKQFEYNLQAKQAMVLGRLVVRTKEQSIIKEQFGRADIKFRKDGSQPLDLGNDMKAATTDALKKCASELGIASDIYGANEFKAIQVIPEPEDDKASVKQIDYAFELLRTSALNDDQKFEVETKLEYGITINEIEGIINNLKMNQAPSNNYSQTDIQKELDKK